MKKRITFIVFSSLMLVLAACSGGGQASTNIAVTLTDFQFIPNVFTVPAGQQITIDASNTGTVVHNFVIMKAGTTAGDTWDSSDEANVYWQLQLNPGASQNTMFTAPTDPGEYQIVCSTPGHLESGMIAKLVVVSQ